MLTRRTSFFAAQLAASFFILLFSAGAFAAGQVQWKSTTLKERSTKSWQLELTLSLAKTPDFANLPMKFEFLQIAYFERAMIDGDKLVERTVPIEGHQPMIESVEVGFMDPGTGTIERRTKFSFKVTRALGYEAGEYRVTIKDARSGQAVGSPQTLKFEGENDVIDRRAIVFTGEKKKPAAAKTAEGDKAAAPADATKPASDATASGDQADKSGADAQHKSEADHDGDKDGKKKDGDADDKGNDDSPSTIKEKPGACGCHAVGSSRTTNAASGAGLLVAGLLLFGRRRRSA